MWGRFKVKYRDMGFLGVLCSIEKRAVRSSSILCYASHSSFWGFPKTMIDTAHTAVLFLSVGSRPPRSVVRETVRIEIQLGKTEIKREIWEEYLE
jgi:hypothetical protein